MRLNRNCTHTVASGTNSSTIAAVLFLYERKCLAPLHIRQHCILLFSSPCTHIAGTLSSDHVRSGKHQHKFPPHLTITTESPCGSSLSKIRTHPSYARTYARSSLVYLHSLCRHSPRNGPLRRLRRGSSGSTCFASIALWRSSTTSRSLFAERNFACVCSCSTSVSGTEPAVGTSLSSAGGLGGRS